jgi:hypothetical protein
MRTGLCGNPSSVNSKYFYIEIFDILNLSISDVKEGRIRNDKVLKMFYDIPCIQKMIAARQLSFIGKVIRGPYDAPARCMLTACCQHKRKIGRPSLHNKDVIVRHLRLLFARILEVVIDDYGSVRDWLREASNKKYWEQLVECLLAPRTPLPTRPTNWPPPRRRSPRTHNSEPQNQEPRESNQPPNSNDSPPIPSPPVGVPLSRRHRRDHHPPPPIINNTGEIMTLYW